MKGQQPALLGGLFIGVLSALPVIKVANCCCLWVIGGGVLTAYLLQQSKTEPIETGAAAISGLIAGLVGGLIAVIAGYIEFVALGSVVNVADQVRSALDQNPQMPENMKDAIMNLVSGKGFVLLALIQLPLFGVFSMLGALLGVAFFKKKTPPAATS